MVTLRRERPSPPPAEPAAGERAAAAQTAQGFHRFVEVACTWIFPALWVVTLYPVVTQLHRDELVWLGALMTPLCWAASDVLTGTIHWMFDTYWEETTPVLGKAFVQPFREHHTHPQNICMHDVVSTVGNSCILGVPLQSGLLVWMTCFEVTFVESLIVLFITLTFGGAALTNLFHRWSHADAPPRWVVTLQRWGLILNPAHHSIHHSAPYDTYYCITCGWMNPILHKLRYFRLLEGGLRLLGIEPSRDSGREG